METLAAVGFWSALLAITLVIVLWLSPSYDRRTAAVWTLLGALACLAKIALFQQTSQWTDIPVDSLKYDVHAQALFLHWTGQTVDPLAFELDGYKNGWHLLFGDLWQPTTPLPYSSVLGTREWIYAAFLGFWHFVHPESMSWAIWSNAAFAGVFPAGTFILARSLGASAPASHMAAAIIMLDPSIGLNASWLLKDTLAGMLTLVSLLAVLKAMSTGSLKLVLAMGLFIGLLSAVRFAAYLAVCAAVMTICMAFIYKRKHLSGLKLGAGMVISIAVFWILNTFPVPSQLTTLPATLTQPLIGQQQTLLAESHDAAADLSVIEWRIRFQENPVLATVTSLARTLMAPYPWVMLTHGLRGDNHIELYYPGTILWIICLPVVGLGMWKGARSASPASWCLLIVLAVLLLAYTVFLGEWSTRQRVFMLPVFFAFAALGWDAVTRCWTHHLTVRRTIRADSHPATE